MRKHLTRILPCLVPLLKSAKFGVITPRHISVSDEVVEEVFEITNKAVEDSLQKIAYNISQIEPVIKDALPNLAPAVPVAPGTPNLVPPVVPVTAAPPPVVQVVTEVTKVVAVQQVDIWTIVAIFGLVCCLGVLFVICMLRGMQGKLDIDPDVVTGKAPQPTLHFRNPFKQNDPVGEGCHNPAYSENNIDNNLAPPPNRGRRSRQKSGGRSEHSNTDESICMDFE